MTREYQINEGSDKSQTKSMIDSQPPPPPPSPQKESDYDKLSSEYNELNDKYIRLYSDHENYKKRTQKEKEELRISTKTAMVSSILDLDSDIAIAMKNIKDDSGLKLIVSKLEKFLNSQGIESIQTETYDVDLHEVISIVEVKNWKEIGKESIVDVVSKGYSLNGKPFRFPKIILGK